MKRTWGPLGLLVACAAGPAWARPPHAYASAAALRASAHELALTGRGAARLHVYLDGSASMRGFALAATANRPDAPAGFASVLQGVDSLLDLAGRGSLRSGAAVVTSR